MKIEQLRSALRTLPKLDAAWSSDDARAALDALDELMAGSDESTVLDFCSRVKIAKPKGRSKANANAALDAELVRTAIEQLRSAASDPDEFNSIVKRLEKEKTIKLAEARAIAAGYAGGVVFKTKRDAFKAIQQRRVADARSDNRRSHISEIF